MKILKVILYSLLVLIVTAVLVALLLVNRVSRSALPGYKGSLVIEGLTGEVTVYRDVRGMPHIYAVSEHDLYFATGYIMAQERLWQMDLIRRATTGRLSEIFGADYVTIDLFLRSLEMTAKSKKVLESTSPEIKECMQAYADGVNSYIKDAGKKLPPEFRILGYKPDPWTLENQANIIGYMGWDLASDNISNDLFNYSLVKKFGPEKAVTLIPDWKAVSTVVFPDFSLDEKTLKSVRQVLNDLQKVESLGIGPFSGSNNWAVSGSRTETGKPVMSNDMHLSFGSPGIWIQMHQVVPGKVNVTGVIVPGQPFVVCGHNEKIAWGMTNLMVDDVDLFAEKINPADSGQYMSDGNWEMFDKKEEVIKIKGGTESRLANVFSKHGPVISEFRGVKDEVITMRWSGFDLSNEIRTVYLLNRAAGWDDFRNAISSFRSISQNIVYADVEGNIGLNTGGGIPIRQGNGSVVRRGDSSAYEWKGYVPFEQLPTSFNPASGYVSSANNRTVGDDYPYYISSDFALPYRINRIREMLESKKVFSIEDFKTMITDQHSSYAALLVPKLLTLDSVEGKLTDIEKHAYSLLKDWDFDMNKDLASPSVFEFMRFKLGRNLLADELGELYGEVNGTMVDYYIYRVFTSGADDWTDNISTPEKETLNDIIIKSFRDAVAELMNKTEGDTSKWLWGDIHKITIAHPMGSVKLLDRIFKFNSKEYRIGGSGHTVAPFSYQEGFRVNHGASERHIFNTANWDESFTVIPTGASGIPASEFYLSQTETYLDGKFYKDAFTEQAVQSAAKYKLVLKPGSK